MLNRLVKSVGARFASRQRNAARQKAARALIGQSELFDAEWYAERYPDVAAAGLDPLDHFIRHGAGEGRNPSDRFDLRWYVKRNPDVARSGINPLLHYLEHGREEGRSMRAPRSREQADEDADLEAWAREKKDGSDKPKVPPYPSDFTSTWQARPVAWSTLPSRLPSGRAGAVRAEADTNGPVNWLASHLQSENMASPADARIRLFQAMQRDSLPASGEPRSRSADAHHLLTAHGLGLEAIADGWFYARGRLMLRVRAADPRATRLRAFQYMPNGDIACCAETEIADRDIQLLDLALEHELCPVLLTWHGSDGTLTSSALLPFPSLFRGGLHHSEMTANAAITGKRDTLGTLMTSLTLQAYCWPDPDEGFAIGRIAVDLRRANGSEALFSANTIAALASQFGIEMAPHGSGGGEALHQLVARLSTEFRGARVSDRAQAGRTLLLPADGFPSLHSLVARGAGSHLGNNAFCVVDAETGEADALVYHPPSPPEMDVLRHPGLPLPHPSYLEEASGAQRSGPHAGAPVMIRFRDAKVWKVDELMPLSPDMPLPVSTIEQDAARDRRSRINVVISRPTSGDLLSLCLTSLSQQTIADDLEIVIVGNDGNDGTPPAAAALLGTLRITICAPSGESQAEQLNRAAASAADYVLFLDASICLPDPRTLEFLLAMIRRPGVASVSCALVREDDVEGSASVECAGYFEQWSADQIAPGALVRETDVARLFPASTFPVVANDMKLCLMPAHIWQDLGGLNAQDFPDSHFDIDIGLRARAAHLDHYCTTLIRAAVAKQDANQETGEEALQPVISQDLRAQLAEQVLRIRKLSQ